MFIYCKKRKNGWVTTVVFAISALDGKCLGTELMQTVLMGVGEGKRPGAPDHR